MVSFDPYIISIMRTKLLFVFLLSFILINSVDATVNPKFFGLSTAKNGEERYWAIYRAHEEAYRLGTTVDYREIDNLSIEIPKGASPIIIGGSQDFKGLKISVSNKRKDQYLFVFKKESKGIDIPQSIIDGNDFRSVPELRSGVKLLLIKDGNPWVENRSGHNYGAERRDVLLIINGITQNKAIMPYGNKGVSAPICSYASGDTRKKRISNLTFIRTADSKCKTCLISIENINNVELSNIRCITPEDHDIYADGIISVVGCTNVTYRNIHIEGTYSQPNKHGYGISMNNVWNVKLYNVSGNVQQGLICNNNVNQSYLKKCNINRYDIHCYGRDVVMEDCTFEGMYFPISSFYGKIVFKRCTFKNSQPVWLRADYNAYVPFDIELYDCTWYPVKSRDSICYTGKLDKAVNSRSELRKKSWPSVKIRGLDVYPSEDLKAIYIFRVGGGDDLNQTIGYMPFVDIKRLNVHGSRIGLDICNKRINPSGDTRVKIKQARSSRATVNTSSIN